MRILFGTATLGLVSLLACSGAQPDPMLATTSAAVGVTSTGTADGAPTRTSCTDDFGSALSMEHGRLDGYLVAIVAPAQNHACSADRSHVHLQVSANGNTYDVAVNADVGFIGTKDVAMPGAPWSEGWSANASLDYVTDLEAQDSDFTAIPDIDTMAQQIESSLASANHISVYGTGYGGGGMHDVHCKTPGNDGALVLNPLATTPHFILFHFADQAL